MPKTVGEGRLLVKWKQHTCSTAFVSKDPSIRQIAVDGLHVSERRKQDEGSLDRSG